MIAAVGILGAGCGDAGSRYTPVSPDAPATAPGTSTSPDRNGPSSDTPTATPSADEEKRMRIEITIGGQRFRATLTESAAARDLIAQLPVTIDMGDHGGVEKTGPLPSPLSLDGQPEGADPDTGDVGYYAPGQDLVLYYGDQSSFPGIVVLGTLEGDAAQQISELAGSVTATVEAR
ncbi:cyclophilin-like fold protein [Humibacillus xanthopallidus]|uniref:cyclophilin-like fold protein n=1 Tax=Humibacillus xanthopallidus TaxID=412689 RepID=UPI00385075BB